MCSIINENCIGNGHFCAVMSKLTTGMATLLDDIASVSATDRHRHLTVLKMATFIAVQLTELYENYHNKPSQDALLTTAKVGFEKKTVWNHIIALGSSCTNKSSINT